MFFAKSNLFGDYKTHTCRTTKCYVVHNMTVILHRKHFLFYRRNDYIQMYVTKYNIFTSMKRVLLVYTNLFLDCDRRFQLLLLLRAFIE